MAGIEHQVSSAYHPQTNGLDKRMNQTVTKAIVKYLNPEQDEHIDAILFSYCTSIHASTKFTPFYLMYGREAVLPVEPQMTDQTMEKLHVDSDTVQSYVAYVEKMKQELFPVVDLNINKTAQKKQKAY